MLVNPEDNFNITSCYTIQQKNLVRVSKVMEHENLEVKVANPVDEKYFLFFK